MLDKIQENWEKCVKYATNVKTRYIEIGDYFDLSDDAPEEAKKAYEEYLDMTRHLERLKEW